MFDLAKRQSNLGTETAFEVLAKAKDLERQGKTIIHLEIGEPDFDTPEHIIDAAKKALDEQNFSKARALFEDVFIKVKNSSIAKDTKEILLEQYYENLVRLFMELDDFEKGDGLIKENQLGSARYHDVAGDFYKHFQDNEMANYHYDLAISFDMDESQKNLIKLKKPLE